MGVDQGDKGKNPVKRSGIFEDLSQNFRLVMRLMGDKRVPFLLKIVPVIGLLWLIFPDFAPGPVDDALAIFISSYLFIELSPRNVVNELKKRISEEESGGKKGKGGDTIDGDWYDVE